MFSFSEFLTEARMAPLYHATHYGAEILKSNVLRVGSIEEPRINVKTVSLTRNFTFAVNWLMEYSKPVSSGIIFELDQQKLAQNYKIIPYNYFGSYASAYSLTRHPFKKGEGYKFENQFEEAVLGDIKDVRKYITKVYIHSTDSIPGYLKGEKFPIYSYQNKKEVNNIS